MSRHGASAAGLLLALLAAGCSTPPADEEPAAPSVRATPAPTQSPTPTPPPAPRRMAVVSHATVGQLALDRATFARLTTTDATSYDGRRVVRGPGALRRVERDPGTLGVVPLADVGPTVTVARVAGRDPVRDDPRATTLTVVGDVMLTRGVTDPAAALRPLSARLRSADLTVGNLESTLSTDGEPTQGGDSFGASPALLAPLRDAGFDALSLANNHAGDYGDGALVATVDTLAASPIASFGAGADQTAAEQPAVLRAGGTTYAFVGFNAIGETPAAGVRQPGALSVRMPPRTGPLVRADLDRVTRLVRRAAAVADVVVVLPHWGTQYTHAPEPIQRRVSRALVRAGADLVVGGHPHWTQGVDVVRRGSQAVPVVHSLGNFVFDMDFSPQTLEGVFLEATFVGPDLRQVRFVPYRMDTEVFAPRAVRGEAAGEVLADLWSTSTGPFAP